MAMRDRGITTDDIIGICSYNHLNSTVPFIAAQLIGCKVCNSDPSLSLRDTTHLMKLIQPKLMFVSPDAEDMMTKALQDANCWTEIVVFGSSIKHCQFSDFLVPQEEESSFTPFEVDSPNKTAVIMFSSGTTGLPKGICLSHDALMANSIIFK